MTDDVPDPVAQGEEPEDEEEFVTRVTAHVNEARRRLQPLWDEALRESLEFAPSEGDQLGAALELSLMKWLTPALASVGDIAGAMIAEDLGGDSEAKLPDQTTRWIIGACNGAIERYPLLVARLLDAFLVMLFDNAPRSDSAKAPSVGPLLDRILAHTGEWLVSEYEEIRLTPPSRRRKRKPKR